MDTGAVARACGAVAGTAGGTALRAPVGTWTLQIRIGARTDASTAHFTPNGAVLLLSGTGGAGTWTDDGHRKFSFRISEPMIDTDGTYTGRIEISQDAVRHGSAFTGTGESHVYDANDDLMRSVAVDLRAERVPARPETGAGPVPGS
ncbi:hypothetical protein [Streptomyces sp. H27-D2]|uniref:hypothetical protein n=1 Tax=Streptomyces sp. H27-D2 TaxID=3046304 RepID=UPI002DB66F09|nr:hypothetical protein [Streptomyces sp. H27-D2]MEC4017668.1 hypothetical protein [Streptomyces sp. H27-D2]